MKKLLLLALAVSASAFAQNAAALLPVPMMQFLDGNGAPLAGGMIYTCTAGSTCTPTKAGRPPVTPLASYTDSTATTQNANPVILDSAGRASIWIGAGSYKIVAQDLNGVTQWTQDNVSSVSLQSQGVLSGAAVNLSSLIVNGPSTLNGTTSATAINAKQLNGAVMADQYCATAGTYDQTCLANALAAASSNARIVLSPHTYNFGSKVTVSNLSNVWIEGPGAVLSANGPAFECDNCTGGGVRNLTLNSATTPTVVTKSALPTSNPATPVVIDRYGTGSGYYPTINDGDIVPTGLGGGCTSGCLSLQQLNFALTTGVIYRGASGVTVSGLGGSYYFIGFYDSSHCVASNNVVMGGSGPTVSNGGYSDGGGGIYFWKESSGSAGNHDDAIFGNVVSFSATSGIMVAGGDHFTISGNVSSYNGESGYKTYQNTIEQASNVSVTGNVSKWNTYDGFDLSSNYPHSSTFQASSVASGNQSDHNGSTGYWGDGKGWTFTGNSASYNVGSGFALDFTNSTIAGNESDHNNTGNAASGFHQFLLGASLAPTNDVVSGNHTSTGGNLGYGLYSTAASGLLSNNVEDTGSNFFAGAAAHWLNYDANGPDSTTTGLTQSQTFNLLSGGSAGWVKLGTWSGSSYGSLLIQFGVGQGANSNSNQQAFATLVVRGANGAAAPNLSGASLYELGNGSAITAVKVAATGGSTSASNGSWDVYIQNGSSSSGPYTVTTAPGATWTNANISASDPGAGSSSVVVGSVFNLLDASGNVNAAGYKIGGTAGMTGTKVAGSCTFTISGGIITAVSGC